MPSVYAPTLVFPNGGERLSSPTLTVRWLPPTRVDDDDRDGYVEVFYCLSFDPRLGADWVMVARVPATADRFEWRVPGSLRSDRLRVAVRTVNAKGERSVMSASAADVSVNRRSVPTPAIVTPRPGDRIDGSCQIAVACDGLPPRAHYRLSYASAKAGVPLTTLAPELLARDIPYTWVTASLPSADDYVLHVTVVDPDGRDGESVTSGPLTVAHEGYLIFDTLPPTAEVVVDGGATFSRSKDVSVGVYADDAATAPQAFRLSDGGVSAPPQRPGPATAYALHGDDGVKRVSLAVQDFGGNRVGDLPVPPSPVNALRVGGAAVADFDLQVSAGYRLVGATSGPSAAAYQSVTTVESRGFPRRVRAVPGEPTAVAVSSDQLYVASRDGDGVSRVRLAGSFGWVVVLEMPTGVWATSMAAFGPGVLVGGSDGTLRRYDGSATAAVAAVNAVPESVSGQPVAAIEPVAVSRAVVRFANATAVGVVTDAGVTYVG